MRCSHPARSVGRSHAVAPAGATGSGTRALIRAGRRRPRPGRAAAGLRGTGVQRDRARPTAGTRRSRFHSHRPLVFVSDEAAESPRYPPTTATPPRVAGACPWSLLALPAVHGWTVDGDRKHIWAHVDAGTSARSKSGAIPAPRTPGVSHAYRRGMPPSRRAPQAGQREVPLRVGAAARRLARRAAANHGGTSPTTDGRSRHARPGTGTGSTGHSAPGWAAARHAPNPSPPASRCSGHGC
jgi:hypothetical protein